MFAIESGKGQKDSIGFKRWEVGAEVDWNYRFAIYTDVDFSRSRPPVKGWEYGLSGSYTNHSYGAYMKYKILKSLAADARIEYSSFRLGLSSSYRLNDK